MRAVTALLLTATVLNMVVVFTSKVVHVLACKTLRLNVIKLIAMVVDSIHKVAHALTCVVVSLNVTALNTVVVFMLRVLVVVAFAVWNSVVTAQIAVCPKAPAPAMALVVACAYSAAPTSMSTTAASPGTALACLVVACLSVTPARVSAM